MIGGGGGGKGMGQVEDGEKRENEKKEKKAVLWDMEETEMMEGKDKTLIFFIDS